MLDVKQYRYPRHKNRSLKNSCLRQISQWKLSHQAILSEKFYSKPNPTCAMAQKWCG